MVHGISYWVIIFFHIHLRQRTWRLLSCLTCQIWTLLDTLDALDTLDTLDTHALKWCLTGTCIMVIAVMGKFGKPTFCGSVQLGNWSILTLSQYWSQPFDLWTDAATVVRKVRERVRRERVRVRVREKERERVSRTKIKVREKVEKSRNTVFFQ